MKYYIIHNFEGEEKYNRVIVTKYSHVLQYIWIYLKSKSYIDIGVKEKKLIFDGIGQKTYNINNAFFEYIKNVVITPESRENSVSSANASNSDISTHDVDYNYLYNRNIYMLDKLVNDKMSSYNDDPDYVM
jgi:hypothetical protein